MSIAALTVTGLYSRYITVGMQAADDTAPVFSTNPVSGAVGDTYLQVFAVAADLEEPLTLYAVALPNAAAAPTEAQIIAGTNAADVAAPAGNSSGISGPLTLSVAGLVASTAYDVFVTCTDFLGNATTAVKLDITTTATPSYSTAVVRDTTRGVVTSLIRSVG